MIAKTARLVLAFLPLLSLSALAGDDDAQLLGKIRALSGQFDKIANRDSSSSATAGLGQAREQYGNYLRDAAASGSKAQELREHAEIFVLSGGNASVLEPWEEGLQDKTEKKLFDGIMSYGQGNIPKAEAALLSLDAASFDPLRGGHLSLAQALLSSRLKPDRAFAYFDMARQLLPGTLVEEAALRQTVVLAAKTGDRERFSRAAISYLSRFRRSAYAANFETQLAFHIARFPGRDGLLILQELLIAHPRGWGRCLACFLASTAEQGVLLGKVDLTSAAVEAAMPLAAGNAQEKRRLLLFSGAALIVTEDFARGLEALHSVEEADLSQKDKELLRTALALAAKLRATPMASSPARLKASASDAPKHDHAFPAGSRVDEAKAALTNADALLTKAR